MNPCAFCSHPSAEHSKVEINTDTVFWPCRHEDCRCIDFAQPGSVSEVTFN